jgi:hypothetical protein
MCIHRERSNLVDQLGESKLYDQAYWVVIYYYVVRFYSAGRQPVLVSLLLSVSIPSVGVVVTLGIGACDTIRISVGLACGYGHMFFVYQRNYRHVVLCWPSTDATAWVLSYIACRT